MAEIRIGQKALTRVRVGSARLRRVGRGGRMSLNTVPSVDAAGTPLTLRWFNQPYATRSIKAGSWYFCYGELKLETVAHGTRSFFLVMDSPELEQHDPADDIGDEGGRPHVGRIVPVYQRIGSLGSRRIRGILHRLLFLEDCRFAASPAGPALKSLGYPERETLFRGVHFPPGDAVLADLHAAQTVWHRGLAFEEFYAVQKRLGESRKARLAMQKTAKRKPYDSAALIGLDDALKDLFPFARLTGEQKKAIDRIRQDMAAPHPMRRLLQGEVGCGKTAVAYAALFLAALSGRQAALMAPTEALAWQHHKRLVDLLTGCSSQHPCRPLLERTGLLLGKQAAGDRDHALNRLASGETTIVVGTHALLEPAVRFRDLALAIIDEQHRFGVLQRDALRAKGRATDVLVISATPIPRTLGLHMMGDMEMTRIRELPLGRRQVRTLCLAVGERDRALGLLKAEIEAGGKGFVICPFIEEREEADSEAAERVYAELRDGPLQGFVVERLHGRMPADHVRQVLHDFQHGTTHVLVTTTVVEVGIDVDSATVMVVLEPERFGLAQLHQLRGRIGRGKRPGWFILLRSRDDNSDRSGERLDILMSSDDGFRIAEADFELRGSGDPIGVRQSGMPSFRVARPSQHGELLLQARAQAFQELGLKNDEQEPEQR